jgi:hypothetical protein
VGVEEEEPVAVEVRDTRGVTEPEPLLLRVTPLEGENEEEPLVVGEKLGLAVCEVLAQ